MSTSRSNALVVSTSTVSRASSGDRCIWHSPTYSDAPPRDRFDMLPDEGWACRSRLAGVGCDVP